MKKVTIYKSHDYLLIYLFLFDLWRDPTCLHALLVCDRPKLQFLKSQKLVNVTSAKMIVCNKVTFLSVTFFNIKFS